MSAGAGPKAWVVRVSAGRVEALDEGRSHDGFYSGRTAMSAKALAWAFEQDAGGDQLARHVLVRLADSADNHNLVWLLRQSRLAESVGVSRATVKRKLTMLQEQGLVDKIRVPDGRSPCLYHLRLDRRTAEQALEQMVVELAADGRDATPIVGPYLGGDGSERAMAQTEPGEVLSLDLGSLPEERQASRKRRRDPVFDALAEVTSASLPAEATLVGKARSQIIAALREEHGAQVLQVLDSDWVATEIKERARLYRVMFPRAALTPTALAKHWNRVGEARAKADDSDSVVRQLGLQGDW